jgi:hypothetical protein
MSGASSTVERVVAPPTGPEALVNETLHSCVGGDARLQPSKPRKKGRGESGPLSPRAQVLQSCGSLADAMGPVSASEQLSEAEQLSDKDPHEGDRRWNKRARRYYSVADLPEVASKACRHCYELGRRDWWIWTWKKAGCVGKSGRDGVATRTPYRCGSWRCPVCRVQEAHVQFARISEAAAPLSPDGWCFLVNTLDRNGTYSKKRPWSRPKEAFEDLQKLSQAYMRNLRRWFKARGWEPLKNHWVCTTECHRSGWPHMNFMVWHPQLADWLREQERARLAEGMSARESTLVCRELADVTTRAGFGLISTAEAARSAHALASYIIKLSGEQDATIGEVVKLCQLPTNAPLRFRRLRSGVRFLPPRKKNPDVTGTLLRRTDFNGVPIVLGLHAVDLASSDQGSHARTVEQEQWEKEEFLRHDLRRRGRPKQAEMVGLPPVTVWHNYQMVPASGVMRQ